MKVICGSFPPLALGASVLLSALLGACAAPVQVPPPPRPAVRPPLPPPPLADWHDLPATPGIWQWRREGRASVARFGEPARFSLTCDPQAGTVGLLRHEAAGAATAMTIRTTSSSRILPVRPASDGVAATLAAGDPLLDAMAYSRGRFAVEMPDAMPLYLPSWPEVSRVVEDCRLRLPALQAGQ